MSPLLRRVRVAIGMSGLYEAGFFWSDVMFSDIVDIDSQASFAYSTIVHT